jgi:prepilin-type N-terminal cleavage/methylation domain-containing protein
MKNTQNKKGFTLVELIIVITILAVLATIAFVSFQGYAADSRDTKVKSELGGLRSSIEAKLAEGVSHLSMVNGTGSSLTGGSLAGAAVSASSTDYKAAAVNFTVLGADASKYTNSYKIGATARVGGAYQLAGKLEKTNNAYVIGNFVSRGALSLSGTAASDAATSKKFTIGDADVGKFKVGDVLSTPAAKITAISSDLKTITLDNTPSGTTYTLSGGTEVAGLIGTLGALGTPVTHEGTNMPY